MLFTSSTKAEVENLFSDTTKMMEDLGQLRGRLARIGKLQTTAVVKDVSEKVEENIKSLGAQVGVLGKNANAYIQTVKGKLGSPPMTYVFGAIALGVAAALVIPFIRQRHS